ncbi:MAG: NAD(P)H-hydrate dehydratase [Acidobacteria bacterium]|nr:NAD(P)H-hydrate dehydratase [Acidobacteriota bacterium]
MSQGARKTGGGGRRVGVKLTSITPARLRRWPLPRPQEGGTKEERGRVLVFAGSAEMPGAAVLAGVAALRGGAGKLQIATAASVAPLVAAAVPEARVFALPQTRGGAFADAGLRAVFGHVRDARAVLVGPGMIGEAAIARLTKAMLTHLTDDATLVLDANALNALAASPRLLSGLGGRAVLTPHATEMSEIMGDDEDSIKADAAGAVRRAADKFGAAVALKGRETFVTAPGVEAVYRNRAGNVGLATSGSGDTLAGLVAGLAARGADPLRAAVWGVHVHALAGERLARRHGPLGYLARELPGEFPSVMARLGAKSRG